MLQLHLSYQQFYCLRRCDLYQRFYGNSNPHDKRPSDQHRLDIAPTLSYQNQINVNRSRSKGLGKWEVSHRNVQKLYIYLAAMMDTACCRVGLWEGLVEALLTRAMLVRLESFWGYGVYTAKAIQLAKIVMRMRDSKGMGWVKDLTGTNHQTKSTLNHVTHKPHALKIHDLESS